jgi:hypothetical protein
MSARGTLQDTYLVAGLKLTVIFTLFLHSIVRQVDHAVCRVFHVVLAAASPQVAIYVPVALQVTVDGRGQCVAADIELSVLVEQGSLDVFLNDVAAFVPVDLLGLHQ